MNIWIAGASGSLGQALTKQLAAPSPGDRLTLLSRRSIGDAAWVRWPESEATWKRLVEQTPPDVLFYLAGSRWGAADEVPAHFEANYLPLTSLLRAVLSERPLRLFLASSVGVYGSTPGAYAEDAPAHPQKAFDFTKYLAEEACREALSRHPNLRVVVGRLGFDQGALRHGDTAALLPRLMQLNLFRPLEAFNLTTSDAVFASSRKLWAALGSG